MIQMLANMFWNSIKSTVEDFTHQAPAWLTKANEFITTKGCSLGKALCVNLTTFLEISCSKLYAKQVVLIATTLASMNGYTCCGDFDTCTLVEC